MPEEAAASCYMALLSEKRAPEALAQTIPAMEFLAHIETCESCRHVFGEMWTFIDAIRNVCKRELGELSGTELTKSAPARRSKSQ
jgi:hypothetical protein